MDPHQIYLAINILYPNASWYQTLLELVWRGGGVYSKLGTCFVRKETLGEACLPSLLVLLQSEDEHFVLLPVLNVP